MLEGSEILLKGLQYSQYKWVKWLKFLKLYLSMEEWFHDSNNKVEVNNAKPLIGEILQTLHTFFPKRGQDKWLLHTQNAQNDKISTIHDEIW
jgi:hypothetical protein